MSRFAAVLGQGRALRMLGEAVAAGRLHHALLFAGPRGIGKRMTADALVSRLFCERPRDGDSCGVCEACRRIEAGTHADLHVVEPGSGEAGEGGRKRSKAIAIEQIRELQVALSRRPMAASRRVAIVDDAERMTIPAQNSLLKTLEEPPGNALLIVVTENPSALTATIRSRCQRVSFAPLDVPTIESALTERGHAEAADAAVLAEHAGGSLGRALALDAAALRETQEALARLLDRVGSEGYLAVPAGAKELLELDEALGGGHDGALALLAAELRRTLRARAAELTPPAKTASLRDDLRALECVLETIDDLGHNANKGLAMERMLVRLAAARSATSIP